MIVVVAALIAFPRTVVCCLCCRLRDRFSICHRSAGCRTSELILRYCVEADMLGFNPTRVKSVSAMFSLCTAVS